MNRELKYFFIIIIALSIILLADWCIRPASNSFGGIPQTTGLIHVNSNMDWIGKMLRDGQFYCVDNIGIDIVHDNHTEWISMKELCNILESTDSGTPNPEDLIVLEDKQ